MIGGEPSKLGPEVPRGFLTIFGGQKLPPDGQGSGRLELAEAIASPSNPLTARVIVNRVWQHHFGRGIVATPSNFGTRGAPPSHPELLDWLTATFIEHGWSIKSLHRLIMRSKTYQLSSDSITADEAIDAANQWYWRSNRQRLDAEAIRDAMLDVSGVLDSSRPGPHPFPPIREWHWTQHFPFKAVYPSNHRSVYLMTQRIQRHPFLGLFDEPDTNTTAEKRASSTVPLQALFLMNSPLVAGEARRWAEHTLAAPNSTVVRINRLYLAAFGRLPSEGELRQAEEFLANQVDSKGKSDDVRAWADLCHVLLNAK